MAAPEQCTKRLVLSVGKNVKSHSFLPKGSQSTAESATRSIEATKDQYIVGR